MNILPQLIVNGLIAGSIMALIALGLSLIYGTMKFMNFAHGEMAAIGAFLYYFFFVTLEWSIFPSILATLLAAAALGWLYNKVFFEPLRKESMWTLLIVSVGVAIFTKGTLALIFGSAGKTYNRAGFDPVIHQWFDGAVSFTNTQVLVVASTFVVLIAMAIFLKKSKTGRSIRALSDNTELAAIVGIDTKKTISLVFVISTLIAALAGVLIAYEQNLSPNMGLQLSVFAFTAVILGGLGNIWGAVTGAMLLGLLQNIIIGIDWFGLSIPSSYKGAVAFAVLILLLFLRPQGLFGASSSELARK